MSIFRELHARARPPMPPRWIARVDMACGQSSLSAGGHELDSLLSEARSFRLESWGQSASNGNTVAHEWAASHGERAGDEARAKAAERALRAMASMGLDLDAQNAGERAALHGAAFNGRAWLLRALLLAGANAALLDMSGDTALHDACAGGHEACARTLLPHGLDPLAKNNRGQTPWEKASERGHGALASLLLSERETRELGLALAAAPSTKHRAARL